MRDWKKSVYLDAEAVDSLKSVIKQGFYYNWIKLSTMSQVILGLIKEHNTKKEV